MVWKLFPSLTSVENYYCVYSLVDGEIALWSMRNCIQTPQLTIIGQDRKYPKNGLHLRSADEILY